MEFSEKALVLKVGRFREIDAWVRLFSPKRGVYTAVAFGGCVSRRRFCGCLDVFNHVDFKVKTCRRGEFLHLLEGRLIESHPKLREKPERLGLAVNCLKFFEAACCGADGALGAGGAYALLADSFRALSGDAPPSRFFPLFFRANVAMRQGFFPDFSRCAACGRPVSPDDGAVFHIEEGRFFCQECPPLPGRAVSRLRPESMALLAAARIAEPAVWGLSVPSPAAGREFASVVDRFVARHMGLSWENGMFVRT